MSPPAIRIDPELSALCPPLTDEELALLEKSLREEGCREPLVLSRGTLIDGHNRLRICTRLGIPYETVSIELETRDHAKWWVARNQLGRRNLTPFARTELALAMEPRERAKAKAAHREASASSRGGKGRDPALQKSAKPVNVREVTAKKASVSRDTVSKVRDLKEIASKGGTTDRRSGKFTPAGPGAQAVAKVVVEKARKGEVSINEATKSVAKVMNAGERQPTPVLDSFHAWLKASSRAWAALGAFRQAIDGDPDVLHDWPASEVREALSEVELMRDAYTEMADRLRPIAQEIRA